MGDVLIFVVWVGINVWSTVLVAERAKPGSIRRRICYALIWLLPFFGAALAIFISGRGVERKHFSANEAMFETVVEQRRTTPVD
jgi:hypothetical protein